MKFLRIAGLLVVCMFCASFAHAQVAVGIGVGPDYGYVGPAPACAYGYYGYYPYACAPYGYYGYAPAYDHGAAYGPYLFVHHTHHHSAHPYW